ncbi:hypothetical protein AVEN_178653-1 [Araneus ventricosus]|uniref:Uncharacterized protein n=1 Tax=Araneus ventricosus TaxID=182803 RepID=A0A4Y2QL51_ARAVE|nr:hypothetical protein AVEN_178653-1 [Araneus ventricosus]
MSLPPSRNESKGSISKVSLDRRRQERMCSGDALLPTLCADWKNSATVAEGVTPQVTANKLDSAVWSALSQARPVVSLRTVPLMAQHHLGWRPSTSLNSLVFLDGINLVKC